MSFDDWAAPYRGTRAVVLGASGFIGRRVVGALARAGADVTAAVRSLSTSVEWSGVGLGSVAVVEHDLEGRGLAALLDATSPAVVFNLAGYGVDPAERDEGSAVRINAEVVEELCDALTARPAPESWSGLRAVHVGSALEYGEAHGDLSEDSTPLPTTLYGGTKLEGTRTVEAAWTGGLPCVTARLFTVYGPGEHEGRLLPTLRAAVAAGGPIPLTDGLQRRDFTYVDDVAEGLLRLGAAGRPPHPTLNLATGVLTEVRQVVQAYARVLGIPSTRLAFGALPTRAEEMAHAPVNVERLRRHLGWLPPTAIDEGLRRLASE